MAGFINKYNKAFHFYYDALEAPGDGIYSIGSIVVNGISIGLITKVDSGGNILWETQYAPNDGKGMRFREVLVCDNGDLLILGVSADFRNYNLTRVKAATGNVQWSRYYVSSETADFYYARFAKLDNDFYILQIDEVYSVPGSSTVGDVDNVIYKINGNGDTVNNVTVSGISKYILGEAIASNGQNFVLVGHTFLNGPGRVGVILMFDSNLKLILKSGLVSFASGSGYVVIKSIESQNSDYIISGITSVAGTTNQRGYIARIPGNGSQIGTTLNTRLLGGQYTLFVVNDNHVFYTYSNNSVSEISKLDNNFNALWNKKVDNYSSIYLGSANNSNLIFHGYTNTFIACTDLDLNSCKTAQLTKVDTEPNTLYRNLEYTLNVGIVNSIWIENPIAKNNVDSQREEICPTGIPISPNAHLQSPHLYLQAAGSTAQDGSAKGIHLRWILRRALGQKHLPKGNYAGTTANFNKPNDFVKIYRLPYFNTALTISFSNAPQLIDDTNHLWLYQVNGKSFYIHFRNTAKYDQVRSNYNPLTSPQTFINQYGNEIIEVENKTELAFSVEFTVSGTSSTRKLQAETLSVEENNITAQQNISIRQTLLGSAINTGRLVAENIRSVRFETTSCSIQSIKIELYSILLQEANRKFNILPLGQYALTKDTNTAKNRLEPSPNLIHGKWLRFNDNAFVNTNNYIDKWNGLHEPYDKNLQELVNDYISLSDLAGNPLANETVAFSDTLPEGVTVAEDDEFEISNLVMLQLSSMDYHIARMLGLGTLDLESTVQQGAYVYIAEYLTLGDLEDGLGAREVQHFYMSLPTTLQDQRLPIPVDLAEPEFGIFSNMESGDATLLTDAEGYTQDGKTRFITLHAEELPEPYLDFGFYYSNIEFNTAESTIPVYAGIEYKKEEVGQNNDWVKPELPNTPEYQNVVPSGDTPHNETVAISIPDDMTPLFIHRERESGRHLYSSYGINWFSRTMRSAVEWEVITEIVPTNQLLPPSNINPVLIVSESPLLLTSQAEQDLLGIVTTPDKTMVRLTFNYHSVHELMTYKITDASMGTYSNPLDPNAIFPDAQEIFADQIEIFFRPSVPHNVSGKALSVSPHGSNPILSVIETGTYELVSTGGEIVPEIPVGLLPNFAGGVMVLENSEYIIHEVLPPNMPGEGPIFHVYNKEVSDAIQTDVQPDPLGELLPPVISNDGLFMAVENMQSPASWGASNPHSFKVTIGDNWPIYREKITREGPDDAPEEVIEKSRGIWENADIVEVLENTGSGMQHLGLYKATFNVFELDHHPQYVAGAANSVDWYNGIIRLHTANDPDGPRKTCEVVRVENIGVTGQKLELYFIDPTLPNPFDPDYDPVEIGTAVDAHYYPGYKVYLYQHNPIQLNEAGTLPATGEGIRYTSFGLRSVDLQTSPNYASRISVPKMMFAEEVIRPQQPELPIGALYATRPDRFGRATYTFTTQFTHTPYAMLFGRTNENAILGALYERDTVEAIQTQLKSYETDSYFSNRWANLLGFDYTYPMGDPVNTDGYFGIYPPTVDGYRFPNPDKASLFETTETPGTILPGNMIPRIVEAVSNAFVPLTEIPPLYQFINVPPYQPIPKKQVVRDRNGALLTPGHPDFEMAPMAKKTGTNQVQFTDFTLDGTSDNVYFYAVRELGNKMAVSPFSPILGPVKLVNTFEPQAPEIKRVMPTLENQILGISPGVLFEINSYQDAEGIRKINLYRTFSPADALTIRTMDLVESFDIAALGQSADSIWQVKDSFVDLGFVPYGDPLYYKLTVSREVEYADKNGAIITEYAPSKPSKLLMSNVVENSNPPAPELAFTSDPINAQMELENVVLEWAPATYNGVYTIYKMNSSGLWVKIHELTSNDALIQLPLVDTDLASGTLLMENARGNPVYHHFKATVENTTGRVNLEEKILTISG